MNKTNTKQKLHNKSFWKILRFCSDFGVQVGALLSLQYSLLLFAESEQMEIREAHILLQDKPFAAFQLSFYEKKEKKKHPQT